MKNAFVAAAAALFFFCSAAYAQMETAASGSASFDTATDQPIQLTLADALQRGLKHNLALLLGEQQSRAAHAQLKLAESRLQPNVSGGVSEAVEQVNLAAMGLSPMCKR